MKILMVCLGNICRSPLAEGILRHKIQQHQLDWIVDSAGTGSWHVGEKPDVRSIKIAMEKGIDITTQRARQFTKADFLQFDYIFVMDSSNYRNVVRLADSEASKQKVELIMNFVRPKMNINVPDPYWDDNGFEGVFDMLDKACDVFIQQYAK
jgi:protein-tyrosine phosphatase